MLKNVKILLGLTDSANDALLKLLLQFATARLTNMLGGIEPPESMEHIIVEATVKRFNRIGSEGLSAHSVEGESLTFADDDFAEFADEIAVYLAQQSGTARGKVRFL